MQTITKRLIAIALLCAAAGVAQQYTKDGELFLPDYRKWVYLGSGLGMAYNETNHENPAFTNVFAEPRAYDSYMKNGVWPDKTVLVAEMVPSATNLSINKSGHAQVGLPTDIEVEVKDAAKGGWAFYGFSVSGLATGAPKGKLFPKSIPCYSCHAEHAAVDNTFVQFYPKLIEVAKRHGTYKDR